MRNAEAPEPATAAILDLMFAVSHRVGDQFLDSDFVLENATVLATFIVRNKGKVSTDEMVKVLAAGGILVALAMHQAVQP